MDTLKYCMPRSLRLLACVAVGLVAIWAARWFALEAVQSPSGKPPADIANQNSGRLTHAPTQTASTKPGGIDSILDTFATPAQYNDNIATPTGLRQTWADQSPDGASIRVLSTRLSIAAIAQAYRRQLAADRWSEVPMPATAPNGAWIGRFTESGRECIVHASEDRRTGERNVVVRVMPADPP